MVPMTLHIRGAPDVLGETTNTELAIHKVLAVTNDHP